MCFSKNMNHSTHIFLMGIKIEFLFRFSFLSSITRCSFSVVFATTNYLLYRFMVRCCISAQRNLFCKPPPVWEIVFFCQFLCDRCQCQNIIIFELFSYSHNHCLRQWSLHHLHYNLLIFLSYSHLLLNEIYKQYLLK